MILERIAIDYRCRECSTIRRVDAQVDQTVLDQLPPGWVMETLGLSCGRCAGSPPVPTAKDRADAKREELRAFRPSTAEVTTLASPVTEALSPLVSDSCTRCKATIGETESWRPDPEAAGFAKAHRRCLMEWAQVKANALQDGLLPEDLP